MARKKGPALYELINPTGDEIIPLAKHPQPSHRTDDDENLTHNVLTPGRSVRMSIGTFGVIASVVVAMVVIFYTLGFNRGEAVAREDYGARLFQEIDTPSLAKTTETPSVVPVVAPSIAPVVQPPTRVVPDETTPRWGTITDDPRQAGMLYFMLSQTTKDGAGRLAAFCRASGLETYAISGDNTRLHRVIALPGFSTRSEQGVEDLKSTIQNIGQVWAETEGRGDNLQDAYLSLYQGG